MKYFGGCDSGSTYTKCVIIDENGKRDGSIKLCRTGIDLKAMDSNSKRSFANGDVPRVTSSDFKEANDHGTDSRCGRDLRQNDKRA